MIFLSFASRFKFQDVARHTFAFGSKRDSELFKKKLTKHYAAKSAELYINGRTAIAEALRLSVRPKTKVIINALTCQAVEQAVKAARCEPLFVDINSRNFNFDIKKLEATLAKEKNISAIIVQNHLGLSADIKSIERLAKKHQIVIIEDLAHCAGSHYDDGREVGTIGSAVALSFGKDKSLDTTSGGALILRRANSALKMTKTYKSSPLSSRLRDRFYPLLAWLIRTTYSIKLGKAIAAFCFKTGWIKRSASAPVDTRIKLPNWQAKLASMQFDKLKNTAILRRAYARRFRMSEKSSILRIPILVNNRDQLIQELSSKGIHLADPWYDVPVSPKRYFARSSFDPKTCPNALRISKHMFNLPLLPTKQLRPILETIKKEDYKYGTKA